jgi:hypothetical protein
VARLLRQRSSVTSVEEEEFAKVRIEEDTQALVPILKRDLAARPI